MNRLSHGHSFKMFAILVAVSVAGCAQPLPPEVEKRVQATDQQARSEIDRHLADVKSVFDEAHRRVPAFVSRVLGLRMKWIYVTRGEAAVKQEVARAFRSVLLSEEDVQRLAAAIIQNYIRTLDDLDTQLLVELMVDAPNPRLVSVSNQENVSALVKNATERISQAVLTCIPDAIAQDIASLVISELATQIVVRCAVSAGTLSAGAASSLYTFGAGILVSIFVDDIIERLTGIRDFVAKVAHEELDKMYYRLVDGDEPGTSGLVDLAAKIGTELMQLLGLRSSGLKVALESYARKRERIRRDLVRRFLVNQSAVAKQ
ncbi:hypothetical protein [Thermogutta sp.]|uniref:hypothetical protein n=1 Tax=Thermogutta sp. TaxID=1962930 RepID=UPI00321FF280